MKALIAFILLINSFYAISEDWASKLNKNYADVFANADSFEMSYISVLKLNETLSIIKNDSPDSFLRIHVDALKKNIDSYPKFLRYQDAFKNFARRHNSGHLIESARSMKLKSAPGQLSPTCVIKDKATFKIYYINGMFNSTNDSLDSIEALRRLDPIIKKKGALSADNRIEYMPLYNDSETPLHQLAQVVKDKLVDNFSLFWDYYYYLKRAPDWFKKDYFDVFVKEIAEPFDNFNANTKIKELGSTYAQIIFNDMSIRGRIPLIIAHSQGGLYANEAGRILDSYLAKDGLEGPRYYGSILLGSPVASLHAEIGGTILRDDDWVMKLVTWTAGTLKPNYKDLPDSMDGLDHNFINAYLMEPKIRKDFIKLVDESFGELIPYSTYKNYGEFTLDIQCDKKSNYSGGFYVSNLLLAEYEAPDTALSFRIKCQNFQTLFSEYESKTSLELSIYSSANANSKGTCVLRSKLRTGNGSSFESQLSHNYKEIAGGLNDHLEEAICMSTTPTTVSLQRCNL